MNYIVGDIGNTSTRICLLNKKFTIIKSYIFDTKKIFEKKYFKNIIKKLSKKKVSSIIIFSSVVPSAFKIIKNYLKKKKFAVFEIKDLNDAKSILDYLRYSLDRHHLKWE